MTGGKLKQAFDDGKGSAHGIGLSNESFCLKPDIFNRILLWRIRRKAQAGDAPLISVKPVIDFFEKGFDFPRAMIACPIPKQGDAGVRALLQEILQKRNGGSRIALLVRVDKTFACDQVECPVVGLLVALIDHGHLNALFRFAPNVPQDIAPQQMTLILKEHH